MYATIRRTRMTLAVVVVSAAVNSAVAEENADKVYASTLQGTVWIVTPDWTGTGWVVDLEKRLLVTNEHVVGSLAEVAVLFPALDKDGKPVAEKRYYMEHGTPIMADVIDADIGRDLAVIRLRDTPPAGTRALKLASKEPTPGAPLHSVGNPSASDALWVYSGGTVRQVYHKEWMKRSARIIETQSPINKGDSGGPVVNGDGEVVGVVSAMRLDGVLVSWCIATKEVQRYLQETRAFVDPRTASDYHKRGVRIHHRGLHKRGLDDLHVAVKLEPNSADILADRAWIYRACQDYDLAIDDANEALRIDPRHVSALNCRGVVRNERGEDEEAMKDFRRAIQVDPRNAQSHANRAWMHIKKGEQEEGIRSYDEAIRLTNNRADWYYQRGLVLEQTGDLRRAEVDYIQAVKLDQSYATKLTLYKTRFLKVANKTGQRIVVHLRYETEARGDGFAWVPGDGEITWTIPAGQTLTLMHGGGLVFSRRMRIWANSPDSNTVWGSKDTDIWTAPANGYRGGEKPEAYTFYFNP